MTNSSKKLISVSQIAQIKFNDNHVARHSFKNNDIEMHNDKKQ